MLMQMAGGSDLRRILGLHRVLDVDLPELVRNRGVEHVLVQVQDQILIGGYRLIRPALGQLRHLVAERGQVAELDPLLAGLEGEWTLQEEAEAKVASLPEELRQFLVRRIEGLAPEVRRVLEAASVMGEELVAAAVAASVEDAVEDVEAVCEGLAAQHHFLTDAGLMVWPDGTSAGDYRFQHALY